jgi:hypothetical protein
MVKQQQPNPWYLIFQRSVAAFLMITAAGVFLPSGPVYAQKRQNTKNVALDGNTRFVFFNLTPAGSYDIEKNGSTFDSRDVSTLGIIEFTDVTTVGDEYTLTLTGVEPVDPSAPDGFQAVGTDFGCANLSWTNPPPTEYVSDYVLLWGNQSGVYTDSTAIDHLSVTRWGNMIGYRKCGLLDGTYFFVLRAHNQFDRWSPLSQETSTLVTNGDTQGPTAPINVSVEEISWGCPEVDWDASGEPTVTGYVLYWATQSVALGTISDYTDTLIVGNVTSRQICGFASGMKYFALKSYTATGLMSAYSQEVSIDLAGADTSGPTFSRSNPADGSTSVPQNIPIFVAIEDDKTGIDFDSIEFILNGQPVVDFEVTGTPLQCMVTYRASGDMPPHTTMTVEVSAADQAGSPNENTHTWSFETGDSSVSDMTKPVIVVVSPANGATGVDENTAIVVSITDDVMGIDPASIVMTVNDVDVPFDIEGSFKDITLTYQSENGFPPGTTVEVSVEACDLSMFLNCETLDDYSFTIIRDSYISLADGSIVPDGFWANAPEKPLEVHNLPLEWTVRIFDAAGTTVRNYKNMVGDGLDWTWDFTNNHGRRVARAIYLIRVTDAGGHVRQTGRFLVQTDP